MRTIVHLSDMHFGSVDRRTLDPLVSAVRAANPDLVAVSGDLTQRARRHQFSEARDFLSRLPSPQIVVPGNHDVPLYNILYRFLRPLTGYRTYISRDLEPFYLDAEIAVLGLNTARSLTFKNGRLNEDQIASIRKRFCLLGEDVVKILVTHHPLDIPSGVPESELLGRGALAMESLAACGVDLLLAGHYHVSYTGDSSARYCIPGYSALLVHAGTASSTRGRGEANTFNVMKIGRGTVTVERMAWQRDASDFRKCGAERFEQLGNRWVPMPGG